MSVVDGMSVFTVNYHVEILVYSSCDVSPQALKATKNTVCSHSQ